MKRKTMKYLIALLFLISSSAFGAPFVVSDTLTPGVTQCGVFVDTAAKVTIPVTAVTGGNICKYDIGTIAAGSHTVRMTAITVNDPIWGSQESVQSSPLSFVRPAAPSAPATLQLAP
jgi:type 1 fimbria pilin